MFWPEAKRYEGDWEENKMHGRGKMTLQDGTIQ